MTTLNSILLQSSGGGGLGSILMIVAMIVIFYFFMIRPQSKKQKELKRQREAMKRGDRIVTAGGIQGQIDSIDDSTNTIKVEIAKGIVISVNRESIYPIEPEPVKKAK